MARPRRRAPGELRYWLHLGRSRLSAQQALDREDFISRALYPEIVEIGLSASLQRELDGLAPGLRASWMINPSLWSNVEAEGSSERRSASVYCSLEDRSFGLALWAEGIEHLSGRTDELPRTAVAISDWLSGQKPDSEVMAARHPFLETDAFAQAFEQGNAVDYLWASFLRDPPEESLRPLLEACAREPRLRQLRPYTGLDQLHFSRWVTYPFSHDLPYAVPEQGRFRVFRPNVVRYLSGDYVEFGVGDTARAVKLLLAALPDPLEVSYLRPEQDDQEDCLS